MEIYITMLTFVIAMGVLLSKKRKMFVVVTYAMLIIIAALRKYTVGIDLQGHYVQSFELISKLGWGELGQFLFGGYDIGYIYFCKLLSQFSSDPQLLIVIVSIISYGSLGLFVYRYSSDVMLDTVMYFVSFTVFMYMSMIAQSIAVAIVLCGFKLLMDKKYVKFAIVVLIATLIHGTAIICLALIPLSFKGYNRFSALGYLCVAGVALFGLNNIIPVVVNTVFPQYSVYLQGNVHGQGNDLSLYGLYNIALYLTCFLCGVFFINRRKEAEYSINGIAVVRKRRLKFSLSSLKLKSTTLNKVLKPISSNLLMFMAVSSLFFYAASFQVEVARRFVYYFSPFTFILLGQALQSISDRKSRQILKIAVYVFTIGMFLYFGKRVGTANTGVIPYEFYWN